MKTKICLFFLLLSLSPLPHALSQVPQGFNYQAVVRTNDGNPIIKQALPVRITIQSDSLGGTVFWQEYHPSVTTSSLGIINLIAGKGLKETSSIVDAFSDIDWSVSPKFIKTEVEYNGWKHLGSARLNSVPYALVAGELAGSLKKLAVNGAS